MRRSKPNPDAPESLPELVREAKWLGSGGRPGVCPCCGQFVAPHDFLVSLDTNRASRWGSEIQLAPQDAEIMTILLRSYPRASRPTEVMAGLYGQGEWPSDPENVLNVKISKLRRTVGPLGVTIERYYGRGYRLSLHDEPVR